MACLRPKIVDDGTHDERSGPVVGNQLDREIGTESVVT
jgi:hypothetical protein